MRLVPKNQGGNVLNTLGGYWKNLSDWFDTKQQGTALDEMGHPIMQSNGEMAQTYSSPKQDLSYTSIAILPTIAAYAGIPATVSGLAAGYFGGNVGSRIGAGAMKMLGGNEEAQEMGSDIGDFLGGLVGFKYGMELPVNYYVPRGNLYGGMPLGKRKVGNVNMRTGQFKNKEGEKAIIKMMNGKDKVNTELAPSLDEFKSKHPFKRPKQNPNESRVDYIKRIREAENQYNEIARIQHLAESPKDMWEKIILDYAEEDLEKGLISKYVFNQLSRGYTKPQSIYPYFNDPLNYMRQKQFTALE